MASQDSSFPTGPNRRRFLQGMAALAPFLGTGLERFVAGAETSPARGKSSYTLFVGTQTGHGCDGIYAYTWNPDAGVLKLTGLAAETPNPTFLALSPDRQLLFAANETDSFQGASSGGVSSFRVSAAGDDKPVPGKLSPIDSKVTGGGGTCYVSVDRTGQVLLCANYGGGSASSFRISPSGAISPAVSHFQYSGTGPNRERQEAPHVHRAMVSPGNRFALFNDLGLDLIHIYALDAATAKLTPHEPSAWQAPAGSGPRALRFHPNGRWAYCVTEMGNTVLLLDWDEGKGTLTTKQQTSLIPTGFQGRSQASEVALDQSGRFLYAADRYYDGISSFTVDPRNGELHKMTRIACSGKTPRFITLDPTERWLLSADQDSDGIEIFARDPKTGRLAEHSKVVPQIKPQCLVFI